MSQMKSKTFTKFYNKSLFLQPKTTERKKNYTLFVIIGDNCSLHKQKRT